MNVSRLGVFGAGAAVGTGAAVALYLAIVPAAASGASTAPPPAKTPATNTSMTSMATPRVVFADCVSPAVLEGQDCVTHIQVAAPPVAVGAATVPAGANDTVRRPTAAPPASAPAPLARTTGSTLANKETGYDHARDDHAPEQGDDHEPE